VSGYRSNEQTRRWRVIALILIVALLALSGSSLANASTPAIDKAKTEAQASATSSTNSMTSLARPPRTTTMRTSSSKIPRPR